MENEFEILIREFNKLNIKELPSSTFLDIVNKSHWENDGVVFLLSILTQIRVIK